MKLVCFGDSNTRGYDPRSYLGSLYSSENRWVDILGAKTGFQVLNWGENGREVPKAAVSFPEDTQLLIVMLGTCNLLQGMGVEETARRMERFISGLSLEREKLLLIAPPPIVPGQWVQDAELIRASRELAAAYGELAERLGIFFADAGLWDVSMAYDGVHFTEQGHRAFARGLMKVLDELSPAFAAHCPRSPGV